MTPITIHDDFLPKGAFENLTSFLTSTKVPWSFHPCKVSRKESTDSLQFVHMFYEVYLPPKLRPPVCNDLHPLGNLIHTLKPAIVLKIKANLTPRTAQPDKTDFHTDFDGSIPCKTAIYYLNTNNGYTEFEDGTMIESIANRLVVFDNGQRHRGVSCTDEKSRYVLNLNYFPIPEILA